MFHFIIVPGTREYRATQEESIAMIFQSASNWKEQDTRHTPKSSTHSSPNSFRCCWRITRACRPSALQDTVQFRRGANRIRAIHSIGKSFIVCWKKNLVVQRRRRSLRANRRWHGGINGNAFELRWVLLLPPGEGRDGIEMAELLCLLPPHPTLSRWRGLKSTALQVLD